MRLFFREITQFSILVRILSALIVGGIIGMERGSKNRPAGLRTYMLVCVGSCLIMLTNQYIYQYTGSGDPMRLGAQVVSGIGFLGAGTIVVTKHNQIKGLTTAAGLWTAAGVGLALGIGFYEAAITAAVCIYIILTLVQKWENHVHKKIRFLEVYLEVDNCVHISELTRQLRQQELHIESIQFEPDNGLDSNLRAMILSLKSSTKKDHATLLKQIKTIDGVSYVEEL